MTDKYYYIQIVFPTLDEKQETVMLAKQCGFGSVSAFLKHLITEKKRDIKTPITQIQESPDLKPILEKIDNINNNLKNTERIPYHIEQLLERYEQEIKYLKSKIPTLPTGYDKFIEMADLNPKASIFQKVYDLVRDNKLLTIEKLVELTNFSEDDIIETLSETEFFKFNFNKGGYELR